MEIMIIQQRSVENVKRPGNQYLKNILEEL